MEMPAGSEVEDADWPSDAAVVDERKARYSGVYFNLRSYLPVSPVLSTTVRPTIAVNWLTICSIGTMCAVIVVTPSLVPPPPHTPISALGSLGFGFGS